MKVSDLIKGLFSDFFDSLMEPISKIRRGSDIDFSEGQYLENIKAIENAKRSDDEDKQRALIKLKIAEKHSNGKFQDLVNIIETAGGGKISEFRGRFDAEIDEGITQPEIIADSLRAGKAAGVKANVFQQGNIFKLDQENLDVAELGKRL